MKTREPTYFFINKSCIDSFTNTFASLALLALFLSDETFDTRFIVCTQLVILFAEFAEFSSIILVALTFAAITLTSVRACFVVRTDAFFEPILALTFRPVESVFANTFSAITIGQV